MSKRGPGKWLLGFKSLLEHGGALELDFGLPSHARLVVVSL